MMVNISVGLVGFEAALVEAPLAHFNSLTQRGTNLFSHYSILSTVGLRRLELLASKSRTWRATNCAIARHWIVLH